MIIPTDHTEKETLHLLRIIADFADEMQGINITIEDAKKAGASQDELDALHSRKFALFNELELKISSHNERLLNKRFNEVKKGGAAAIIKHAKELAEESIGALYVDTKMNIENMQPEEIQKMTGITIKNGEVFLTADHAVEFLNHVLYRHIKALADDKDRAHDLQAAIIEAVNNSPCTYGGIEALEDLQPAGLVIYKREPIKDIGTFGLMNDLVNTFIIEDPGIKQTDQDGNIQFVYKVDQTKRTDKKNGGERINTYLALTYYEDDVLNALPDKINAYDMAVLGAIANLFYFWNREHPGHPLLFTCQEAWRRMNGIQNRDSKVKAGPEQIKRIRGSIEKMRHIDCHFDVREEINSKYMLIDQASGERIVSGKRTDYFLDCSKNEFYTERGRILDGYLVSKMPILYTYNELKNHVINIPFDALDTIGTVRDGENVTEFKYYLLQQIYLMKNGKRDNPKILLNTIYKKTGIFPPEERIEGRIYTSEAAKKQAIRRIRGVDVEKITGLLEAMLSKGILKSYKSLNAKGEPAKGNQRIESFIVTVSEEIIDE